MTQELHGVISLGGTVIGGSLNQRGLKGETGDKGDKGDAATIAVGTTTTGAAGTNASVTNSGDEHDAVFDFIIPKGDKGDTGDVGAFIAEYGVTTYSEIVSAISQKKVVLCHAKNALDPDLDYYFVLSNYDGVALPSVYTFVRTVVESQSASFQYVTCDTSNEWDIGSRNLVPQTRTVNGKALSQNITLDASDVGAQETLVSGTNIKTINGESLLGSGNIDTMQALKKALPTDTASGAIASFPDGSDLFDYLSCIVDIEPLQDLHGYDKPWVGGVGSNKWDEQWEIGGIGADGSTAGNTQTDRFRSKNFIPCSAETSYYFIMPSVNWRAFFYDSNEDFISLVGTYNGSRQITTPLNASYIKFWVLQTTYSNDIAINYPSSVTTYSPWENICPITGWTGCDVEQTGLNLISPNRTSETNYGVTFTVNADKSITVSGTATQTTGFRLFDYILKLNLQIGKTYHIKLLTDKASTIQIQVYKNGSFAVAGQPNQDLVYIVPSDSVTNYVRIRTGGGESFDNVTCKVMITLDEEATEYVPPVAYTYPVSWQTEAGTVYGGTVDVVSGVLTVAQVGIDMGSLSWSYDSSVPCFGSSGLTLAKAPPSNNDKAAILAPQYETITMNALGASPTGVIALSAGLYMRIKDTRYTDAVTFKASLSGQIMVYELATPTTYQLDPVQVACLLGHNNVWANCGSIEEVKYKADVQKWVEKKLGE